MQRSSKEEIKYLEHILSENSNSILFARLADAYIQVDRIDDAIELCELGVKKHPTYVTGHFVLGKCYLKKKLLDQAEKELKRAIMYDPKYIAAHREYGELMAQIGWHTTCDMTFEEIIRIDPLNEKVKTRLAEIKKQLFLKQEEKKEVDDESKFAIKEMNNSFVGDTEQIEEEKVEKKEIEIENFDTDDRIQEEKTETDTEDISDDQDASMELLEDIFRDTSIPELDSKDLTSFKGKPEADIKSPPKTHPGSITSIDESPESSQFDSLTHQEPGEFQIPDEKVKQSSESEMPGFTEEPRDPFDPSESEQSARDDSFPRGNDFPSDVPGEELTSLEKPMEPTTEQPDDPFFGFNVEKPGEDDEIDVFKSIPTFQSQEKMIEKPDDTSQFGSKPGISQIKKEIEPKRQEQDEETQEKKKEKIVTPTLGEIYIAQHQYSKAINVYELLMKKEPDNELYKQKIEYLYKKLEESENE